MRGYLPESPFGLYENGVEIHQTLRLLLGTVNLFDKQTQREFKLNSDELRLSNSRSCDPNRIVRILFNDEISVDDYRDFLVGYKQINRDYFLKLNRELSLCLICKKHKQYSDSFIYLYRILEYVSVAFPFIYAAIDSDFKRASEFLSSLYQNQTDRDLKSLRQFTEKLSRNAGLEDLTIDFDPSGIEVNTLEKIKSELLRCACISDNCFGEPDQGDTFLSVRFKDMPSMIINVRNKLFHNTAGGVSFNIGEIGDTGVLLKFLISGFVQWFAAFFVEMMRVIVSRRV